MSTEICRKIMEVCDNIVNKARGRKCCLMFNHEGSDIHNKDLGTENALLVTDQVSQKSMKCTRKDVSFLIDCTSNFL